MMISETLVGGLIGKQGYNISRIRNESGATIKVRGTNERNYRGMLSVGLFVCFLTSFESLGMLFLGGCFKKFMWKLKINQWFFILSDSSVPSYIYIIKDLMMHVFEFWNKSWTESQARKALLSPLVIWCRNVVINQGFLVSSILFENTKGCLSLPPTLMTSIL